MSTEELKDSRQEASRDSKRKPYIYKPCSCLYSEAANMILNGTYIDWEYDLADEILWRLGLT